MRQRRAGDASCNHLKYERQEIIDNALDDEHGPSLDEAAVALDAALRQRADEATSDLQARLNTAIHQLNYWRSEFNEATRAENEACATLVEQLLQHPNHTIAAAIRARSAP